MNKTQILYFDDDLNPKIYNFPDLLNHKLLFTNQKCGIFHFIQSTSSFEIGRLEIKYSGGGPKFLKIIENYQNDKIDLKEICKDQHQNLHESILCSKILDCDISKISYTCIYKENKGFLNSPLYDNSGNLMDIVVLKSFFDQKAWTGISRDYYTFQMIVSIVDIIDNEIIFKIDGLKLNACIYDITFSDFQ